jgi:hypothetical protein
MVKIMSEADPICATCRFSRVKREVKFGFSIRMAYELEPFREPTDEDMEDVRRCFRFFHLKQEKPQVRDNDWCVEHKPKETDNGNS